MFKFNNSKNGLTLIDTLIVISIFSIIIMTGMVVDLNIFKIDTFAAERSTIVSVLSRARSHAMANMFESAYGVCYESPNYIIFRGRSTCLPTSNFDEIIPANINIASNASTIFPTIIFNQLTGGISEASLTIHITDNMKSGDITINHEGTINW